jgi:hypothetical protein
MGKGSQKMIRMNITPLPLHKHRWESEGFASSSMCGLARKLKEAGFPDQPFECFRGDKCSMVGKSLYWAAGRMAVEGSTGRARYVKYSATPYASPKTAPSSEILGKKSERLNATAPVG